MWLLNAGTLELELFYGESVPPYAILSHRWRDEEVLYQDLTERKDDPNVQARTGLWKIRKTCELALADGLGYAWVDTCCIDKRSSAELSEAINSMFLWYWRAAKCYAYLDDVDYLRMSPDCDPTGDARHRRLKTSGFLKSSWFTRGWTLQELLAPRDLIFYDKDWNIMGTRQEQLTEAISEITKIDRIVLEQRTELKHMSVAKRMSWAAERTTTRIEDKAYSLLGIFGVNMPMLYGEENRAFIRLQQEIIRTSTDQSILTWCTRHDRTLVDGGPEPDSAGILATTPSEFASCRNILFPNDNPVHQSYDLTNAGLRMKLPVVEDDKVPWGILNCQQDGWWLGIQLERVAPSRLHETKKLLEKDLNAYTILPIREGSHTKYMSPAQTQKAELEDIIIIARSNLSRSMADSRRFINLRFINCYTSHPKTRYEIVEMTPPEFWDQSNPVQPANHRDHLAVPFRPNWQNGCGSIILEDAANKHRIEIRFGYTSDQRANYPMVASLQLSEISESWRDWSQGGTLRRDYAVLDSEALDWKPITASLEVRGVRIMASLQYQTNANGEREVELRLKESSGLPEVFRNAWNSDVANQGKEKAAQLFGSVTNTIQSNDMYKRAKGAGAPSVRSGSMVKTSSKETRNDSASVMSSASKGSKGSKGKKGKEDVAVDSGFNESQEQR